LISTGAPSQTLQRKLTVLPRHHSWILGVPTSKGKERKTKEAKKRGKKGRKREGRDERRQRRGGERRRGPPN